MRAMQSEQLCGCEPLLFVFDKISTSALCPDKHGPVASSPLSPITLPGCQHVSQLNPFKTNFSLTFSKKMNTYSYHMYQ